MEATKKRRKYRFKSREEAEQAEERAQHKLLMAEVMLSAVIVSIHYPRVAGVRTFKSKPVGGAYYTLRVMPERKNGEQFFVYTFFCPGQHVSCRVLEREEVCRWRHDLSRCQPLDVESRELVAMIDEALAFRFPDDVRACHMPKGGD